MELKRLTLEFYLFGKFVFTYDGSTITCDGGIIPLAESSEEISAEVFIFNVLLNKENSVPKWQHARFEQNGEDVLFTYNEHIFIVTGVGKERIAFSDSAGEYFLIRVGNTPII